ncbi:MAG: diphthamide synthesis protein [Candidatus Nanoarchaeia archaeon]|nr:diphthamide synthesis protein [Candidatus Nanoarchaeia archaeon]MDD5239392.1 diphthamide synthesis protein [Candidatus Nanoarchaeia archaeon]
MKADYELEIETAKKAMKETKAKRVLIQLPEGLKPLATSIVDRLSAKNVEIVIWFGTCFGACDTPNVKEFDLLIQFGHAQMG